MSRYSFRITSTYVENTDPFHQSTGKTWDHLHLRGEHQSLAVYRWLFLGSPPLTWRTLDRERNRRESIRITSTYVENTIPFLLNSAAAWDHLHLRGEHHNLTQAELAQAGSPPLTWRTLKSSGTLPPNPRITSTYVENTRPRLW